MRLAHSLSLAEGSIGNMRKAYILNIRFTLPLLLILALLVAAVLTTDVVRAQAEGPIKYVENGTEPVATFTAMDPEGAMPIAWYIAPSGSDPDGSGPLSASDAADAADFDLDEKTGVLTFDVGGDDDNPDVSVPPDFENGSGSSGTGNNTYAIVVVACDVALVSNACPNTGVPGYEKVTVEVTDEENEQGKVTVATNTDSGTPQYLVGATLTATASDGDISDATQTFTTNVTDEVSGVVWRWYRGDTEITDADARDNAYTLTGLDTGQHIRVVVYYIVEGNADQEMAELTTDYPVLAARVGTNQLKFAPAVVSRTISEGDDKDRKVGAPVTATGNHGTIRYTLSGTDADQFAIDKVTGQITTKVALNYEADTSNTVNQCNTANECSVTVTANDSTGDASTPTASVTIKITDEDEPPVFGTAGAKAVSVPENSKVLYHASTTGYNQTAVGSVTYTATDPEGRTVNYSLAGPDASKFKTAGAPPVLSFVSAPNYEAKASADGDNVYEVTIQAAAGGETAKQMVEVTVGDVNEGPDISGLSTKSYTENGTSPVETFRAKDPEGATPIAWFVAASDTDFANVDDIAAADAADAGDFDIDEKTGALVFDIGGDTDNPDVSVPPDFENPSGEGASSNTYKVVVGACDVALVSNACTGVPGYHKITVEVTDANNEQGKVTVVTSTSSGTPQYLVGATLTATASDGDISNATQTFTDDVANEVGGVVWEWYRGSTKITTSDAQDNTYTLTGLDTGQHIRVVVKYQINGDTARKSASLTTDYPVLATRVGTNQLKFDPAAVSRTVSEGDKGRKVGAPVTATGNHGTIRYTLSGTDADQFAIDKVTGQITTKVALNYEADTSNTVNQCNTANECSVTVTANDSTGDASTPTASVTIKITDEDEPPVFGTAGAKAVSVPENSKVLYHASASGYNQTVIGSVTYTATDPEGSTVSYSLMGPDASKFQISGIQPVLSFVKGPNYEAKASADGDNMYEVTIQAVADGDTAKQMVEVTVGEVDEAPVISAGPTVSGRASVDYAENGTGDVASYGTSGFDGTVTWSLSGDDAGDFSISSGGALSFASSPDYENPDDANTDNVYEVTVNAGDGTDSAMRDVRVTVTDVDDSDLRTRYDADGNGSIDLGELNTAIDDYLAGRIELDDVIEVINHYLGN